MPMLCDIPDSEARDGLDAGLDDDETDGATELDAPTEEDPLQSLLDECILLSEKVAAAREASVVPRWLIQMAPPMTRSLHQMPRPQTADYRVHLTTWPITWMAPSLTLLLAAHPCIACPSIPQRESQFTDQARSWAIVETGRMANIAGLHVHSSEAIRVFF